MESENFRVETVSCSLSNEEKSFIKHQLDELMWCAPHHSYAKLLLCLSKDHFEGLLTLNSFTIRLKTHHRAQDVKRAVEVAIRKMSRRLKQWQKCRSDRSLCALPSGSPEPHFLTAV